jgi:uncharacterized protein YwbE
MMVKVLDGVLAHGTVTAVLANSAFHRPSTGAV